jgi:hypothetical protein
MHVYMCTCIDITMMMCVKDSNFQKKKFKIENGNSGGSTSEQVVSGGSQSDYEDVRQGR